MRGRVEFDVKGEEVIVKLGVPGYTREHILMTYRIEFAAESFRNISMERGKPFRGARYPEWPPTKVGDRYVLEGLVAGFPWDEFALKSPQYIKVELLKPKIGRLVSEFDAYLNGELQLTGVRRAKLTKCNHMIEGAIAGAAVGAIAGAAAAKDAKTTVAGGVLGAAIGGLVGYHLTYYTLLP